MHLRKLLLLPLVTIFFAGCGSETTPSENPNWDKATLEILKYNYPGADVPYFSFPDFGKLSVNYESNYLEVIGDKELKNNTSFMKTKGLLEAFNYIDKYKDIRSDTTLSDKEKLYLTWNYPMQLKYKNPQEKIRYLDVYFSSTLRKDKDYSGEDNGYFYAKIENLYKYSWTDVNASDIIAYGFDDSEGELYSSIVSELVPFNGDSTYKSPIKKSDYPTYVDENGYLPYYIDDVEEEVLVAYKDSLLVHSWEVIEHEVEHVYDEEGSEKFYTAISSSGLITLDIYYGEISKQVVLNVYISNI